MYLVTTALREFWPASGPVWLMSPGCQPFPEDLPSGSPWEIKGIVQDPWDDPQKTIHAREEVEVIYERLLPALTDRMNLIHGTGYSDRYWRILLGLWLKSYVAVIYDRYKSLIDARAKLGAIETIGLDESYYVVPATTLAYLNEVRDDLYNLQIYTRLSNKLGNTPKEVRKPTTARNPQKGLEIQHSGIMNIVRKTIFASRSMVQKVIAPHAKVILNSSYFPQTFQIMLMLATGGRVMELGASRDANTWESPVNLQARNELRLDLGKTSECEKVIAEYLHMDVPIVYVENYESLCKYSADIFRGLKPKVILSMNSWWFDEAFKHWAAGCAEKGTLLVGGQHGGCYGIERNHWGENHEKKIVDKYFTWGWSEIQNPKVIPTPASKLINLRKRPNKIAGKGILYVGTTDGRFGDCIRMDFAGNINWQHRFFKSVSPNLIEEFRVRLHFADFGWGIKYNLEKAFPKLQYDTWDRPFRQSLHHCRLCICENLSTTYLEALASNVPTIVFWNEAALPIRESAKPFINGLKACSIIHDTPESAAAWISEVYPNLESWWLSDKTQQAVLNFCGKYAGTSKTPLRDWMLLLNQLSAKKESYPCLETTDQPG